MLPYFFSGLSFGVIGFLRSSVADLTNISLAVELAGGPSRRRRGLTMTSPPAVTGVSLIDAAAWASGHIPGSSGGSGLGGGGIHRASGPHRGQRGFCLSCTLGISACSTLSSARGSTNLSFYLTRFLSGPLLDRILLYSEEKAGELRCGVRQYIKGRQTNNQTEYKRRA